ncbi:MULTISPECIES: hypothetical protein [unclassified Variovorax]|uniref:hypothetical protein n=1 Tax=unclassified Variovorax TaxID=663243 RepID=UPI001BD602B4|nr:MULTISPECIES: hypothetical protein [unclassified Variovorax]
MNAPLRPRLRILLRGIVTALLVPVLLFEEWGWGPLAALAAQLGRLPQWARLERKVSALPPWGALVVLVVPMAVLFPVKLMALYLFGEGHFTTGFALLIGAKIAGTAIVARLFQLTLPALMEIPVFATWYPRWKAWKDRVLSHVRQSAPWRAVRAFRVDMRRRWRALRQRAE